MPVGGALGMLGSAFIGANAADTAASEQEQAEEQAQQTQLQMYNQTRTDLQPYRTVGRSALGSIASMYGLAGPNGPGTGKQNFSAFTNSPDYQFALQQGNQAVDRAQAASGGLLSGGQLKASQEFGQGLASQQFSNYYNRLMSLSGLGESAASQTASANQSVGNSLSSLQAAQGASAASGTVGSAGALTSGLSALSGYAMLGKTGSSYNNSSSSLGAFNPSNFSNTLSGSALSSLGNVSLPNNSNGALIGYG